MFHLTFFFVVFDFKFLLYARVLKRVFNAILLCFSIDNGVIDIDTFLLLLIATFNAFARQKSLILRSTVPLPRKMMKDYAF